MKRLVNKIISKTFWTKLFFPFLGIGSLIWFLIRVIPKPSRATYPCMRVAAPLASSFVIYIISLAGSIAAFKYAKIKFKDARYLSGILALIVFISLGSWFVFDSAEPAKAKMLEQLPANVAIGEAKGIIPGRVVWYWDPDATDENCDGTFDSDGIITDEDNVYYAPKNNNEITIKNMMSETILALTGTSSLDVAWDSIFTYYNRTIKGETHGYQAGDKIFIKTNNQGVGLSENMNADLAQREENVWGFPPDMAATSPYTILATLDQLVNNVGVPQNMIFVGDPHLNINKVYYEILSADFPDVHYMGVNSTSPWNPVKDIESYGRTLSIPTDDDVIFYSDRDIADPGTDVQDKIYQQMYDADYIVNIAALKGHIRAGITLLAKSHFGSHTESSAFHLHRGLVSPGDNGEGENQGYGKYRVLVDLLGHEHIGGKTVLNIIDGLWGGNHHELKPPRKWDMAPFNGDYCSSIFASIDPIALESVGHDFLRTEYNVTDWGDDAYPNFEGTDDHLQQAADSTKWPEGFIYDPENDGTPIKSLGTHEHWNNATDMQYLRNLYPDSITAAGIELIKLTNTTTLEVSNPISNMTFEENSADTTIDLSGVFSTSSSDPITYTVENQTNPSLITATIEDSALTLSFTADETGTDVITIQASVAGKAVTTDFEVNVTQAAGIATDNDLLPAEYNLSQNYPNPFNPETTIGYALPRNSQVIISVYDVNGRFVTDILNTQKSAGYHTVKWNASEMSTGIYFYHIKAENFTQVKKCMLIK